MSIYRTGRYNLHCDAVSALSPYIIGTSNQPVKMIANHGLHLSFRLVKGVAAGVFPLLQYRICPDYTEVTS